MKTRLLLLLLFVPICISAQLIRWDNSYYHQLDHHNYTSYELFSDLVVDYFDVSLLEAAIFFETNVQREAYGRSILVFDARLNQAAREHSVDMVKNNYFSHVSPTRGRERMVDRFGLVGYTNVFFAENISYYYLSGMTYIELARAIVDSWMNSEGHRRNILNDHYHKLGVGCAFYWNKEYGQWYVKNTQNFVE